MTIGKAELHDFMNSPALMQNFTDKILSSERSILSYVAEYWNELTLWQRFMGGVLVSGLPLSLSVVTQSSSLLILAGMNALIYVSSGIILDEHAELENKLYNKCIDHFFNAHKVKDDVLSLNTMSNSLSQLTMPK